MRLGERRLEPKRTVRLAQACRSNTNATEFFDQDDVFSSGTLGGYTFRGTGSGTLEFLSTIPAFEFFGSWMRVADLDEDGFADLIDYSYNCDELCFFYGNGDGTFSAPTMFLSPVNASSIYFRDFNADGHLDMMVTSSFVGVDFPVYLGNGTGTFESPMFVPDNRPLSSQGFADFNEDGHLDMVGVSANVSGPGTQIELRLGDGAGGFSPIEFLSSPLPRRREA